MAPSLKQEPQIKTEGNSKSLIRGRDLYQPIRILQPRILYNHAPAPLVAPDFFSRNRTRNPTVLCSFSCASRTFGASAEFRGSPEV
jgi:hypothetical protein